MGLASFFGFGRGKLAIQLDKYQFTPGERMNGKVIIKLKKPIESNEVKIKLRATEERRTSSMHGSSTSEYPIYDQEFPISKQPQTYGPGEHTIPFSIIAPQIPAPQTNTTMANIVNAANVLINQSITGRRIKWTLHAQVDIPKAIDMRKRIKIDIQPGPAQATAQPGTI